VDITGRFIPGIRVPIVHRIEGWVGSRAGLDAVMRKKKKTQLLTIPNTGARGPLRGPHEGYYNAQW